MNEAFLAVPEHPMETCLRAGWAETTPQRDSAGIPAPALRLFEFRWLSGETRTRRRQ